MTKDKLMLYTFIALLILTIVSTVMWWPVTTPSGWSLGLTVAICALIAVGIAVALDALISKVAVDSQINTMSAAVFGLIVTLSYTLGVPSMAIVEVLPLEAPNAFLYVALISLIGLVVFKKLQGLAGRKYVNPAATAKLVVLLPFLNTIFLVKEHFAAFENGGLSMPVLAGPIGETVMGNNGLILNGDKVALSFVRYLQGCFGLPTATSYTDVNWIMIVEKYHGWVGGASSLAVIIVGIGLFILARRYIKWRVTLSYLLTVTVMALVMTGIYGGDPATRLLFELFIGSSIFLAFFMATDPATTPLTHKGQLIFGVGLGVLTVLIQTYMNFFGGSILALVIMNLITPRLDKIGKQKPVEGGKEPKMPKAKMFTKIKTTACIRCGACMTACCNKLSPILIKQARDKRNVVEMMKLDADFCAGCGNCNFVCPAKIDLRSKLLNFPLAEDEMAMLEGQFLSGTTDEDIGVYSDIFSAKSSYQGQDGGVATALLVSGMQKGLFDAAIVVRRVEGYKSTSFVAESVDDIVKAKGTKYMRVRMMSKLGELVAKGKRKIAVIGTPCQIRAARRIQQLLLEKYPDLELTMIGLFCFEEFDYNKLKEETKKLLKVDLDKAEKTQIHKGKFIVRIDGKESSVAVKELNNAVENGCLSCPDFPAKYADISVGSVGSEEGYSTVIVRSAVGEKLLEKLDLAKGKVKKEEIAKLAVQKKKRALQNS
jgi:coenzyme F420-reducing hydrogenase beta subunit/Na+-translocating ferredoxin:NAD+ oxidoreductase RnfD subunit